MKIDHTQIQNLSDMNSEEKTNFKTSLDEEFTLQYSIKYPDGVPCDHPGCWAHRTHPCECCGRIECKGDQ